MKRIVTISGKDVGSLDDFYDRLADQLPLPPHFGRNLDALWDVLSNDVEGPFSITWKHAGVSRNRMGRDYDSLILLLHDLEAERDDFRLVLET